MTTTTGFDSYTLNSRVPNMANEYDRRRPVSSGCVLLTLLALVACDESYTPPQDTPADVGGCAYDGPAFENIDGWLVCSTEFASSDGATCFWPCAMYENTCGASLVVRVDGEGGYHVTSLSGSAAWCN